MNFSNGFMMPGYSSDEKIYDSYRKFLFCHYHKYNNARVLDVGSNQGFFTFQAALAGAKHIDSIEQCEEDMLLAKEIQNTLAFKVPVDWHLTDANKFVLETRKKYDLVLLLSVIHQIYPDFNNIKDFITRIRKMCKMAIIEPPINHPRVRLTGEEVVKKLKKHFPRESSSRMVRPLYTYNAYSKGERLLIACYCDNYVCDGAGNVS